MTLPNREDLFAIFVFLLNIYLFILLIFLLFFFGLHRVLVAARGIFVEA